jgi:dTMP kinase
MFDVLFSIRNFYKKYTCDTLIMIRYLIGTAYLPNKLAKIGYNFFYNFVPTSKYMFFLDASPEVLIERVKNREQTEIFETLNELRNVRKKSFMIIKNWNIIDTSGSIEDTYSQIEKILDNLDKKT